MEQLELDCEESKSQDPGTQSEEDDSAKIVSKKRVTGQSTDVTPFGVAVEVKRQGDTLKDFVFTKEMKIAVLAIEKAWCKYKNRNEDVDCDGFEKARSSITKKRVVIYTYSPKKKPVGLETFDLDQVAAHSGRQSLPLDLRKLQQ